MIGKPCASVLPAHRRAVTLVELLAVMAILIVLAGLGFVMYSSAEKAANGFHVNAARARANPKSLPRMTPPVRLGAQPVYRHVQIGYQGPQGPGAASGPPGRRQRSL